MNNRFGVQNRDLEFLGDNRGFKEAGRPRFFPFIGESLQRQYGDGLALMLC